MAYYIREVDPFDEDVAFELTRLHGLTFPKDTLPGFDRGWWWLAYQEALGPGAIPFVVGFAGLQPSIRWEDTGVLARTGVAEGHRGHGLQRRFVRVRERKARKLGWAYMITDTTEPASANNLARCGYRMFTPSVRWALNSSTYWRKTL